MDKSIQHEAFVSPMDGVPQKALGAGHTFMPVIRLAALVIASASVSLLPAQELGHDASETALISYLTAPDNVFDFIATASGQPHANLPELSLSGDFNQHRQSRPNFDPFEPRPNLSDFCSSPSCRGFSGVGDYPLGRRISECLNHFGDLVVDARQGTLLAVAPVYRFNLAYHSAKNSRGLFNVTSSDSLSLNELMRDSFSQPLMQPAGSLLPFGQSALAIGSIVSKPIRLTASALLASADLGNGVSLSAGMGSGMRSMAGAAAAVPGTGAGGGLKRSGTSLNLKFSF